VAKIVPMNEPHIKQRLGVAKGKFQMPDNFDAQNDEVARLFLGSSR
jgi:antitoxin (DNA-binding transcriptional repressor) of toxin-antitoxin stability system